ncbi:16S rRNA (cytosine(1402)-N(4))-methyltransferase RsmH [Marivibrio halodurans]|nr:16S rRNA (cytosine(1402)-N(4))-methyltransferase RsmH [Marivibrio halodurans]
MRGPMPSTARTEAAGAVHLPVMLEEVIARLAPADGEVHLDGTFGAGGYARAILGAADCRLLAIDRDPAAIARGRDLVAASAGRLTLLAGRFAEMEALLAEVGVTRLDGVVLDLGVSSPQIDDADRGFSFRFDGPLDMRMSMEGPTAADVVNGWEETDLTRIIREYGEERFARRIARAIVAERADAPIETTARLAAIVRGVVPKSKDGIDPATRTFQALRLEVNDELGELDRALLAAERLLAPGGRLVVVSFHSLEDRRVKTFLKARSGRGGGGSRHMPQHPDATRAPSFRLESGGVEKPGEAECRRNPRARSARLRHAVRTDAPVWAGGTR